MTSPVQVLREALILASDDHVYISQIRDPALDALQQVEALVRAARHAEHKLRIEYRRNPPFGVYSDDESWAEGETLADALAPFKENP